MALLRQLTPYLDATAALMDKSIPVSANIQGIGFAAKGFAKPTIGMGIRLVINR